MLRKKGQSTLEYIIILSAVVLALIVGRSKIQTAIDTGLGDAAASLTAATGKLPK